jgi:hypothetical protein
LRGREGFGFLSPSRRARSVEFDAFVEVKRLFFTDAGGEETEAKESHWGDWTLDRTRLARPVSSTDRLTGRSAGVCHWRVRSHIQESCARGRFDRTPGRVRSHATGRVRSTKSLSRPFLYSNRTPRVTRSVSILARPVTPSLRR